MPQISPRNLTLTAKARAVCASGLPVLVIGPLVELEHLEGLPAKLTLFWNVRSQNKMLSSGGVTYGFLAIGTDCGALPLEY